MTWQRNRKRPNDHLYYSDFVPFAHDPPGHTCGLPCCNSDLYLHLNISHHGGCMPTPFTQIKEANIPGENFTLRRSKDSLLIGKPVFKKEGFHSLRPGGYHGIVNGGGNKQQNELSEAQKHFLHGRGITLPRYNASNVSNVISSANKRKRIPSESSSESEYEIESRRRIPQTFESDGKPIMSRKLIQARNSFEFGIDGPYALHNNEISDYETVIPHRHNETDTASSVQESTDDDVFFAPSGELYYNTNTNFVSQLNVKHGSSNQIFASTKQPNVRNDFKGYSDEKSISSIHNHPYVLLKNTEKPTNVHVEMEAKPTLRFSDVPSNIEKCSVSSRNDSTQRPLHTSMQDASQTASKPKEHSKEKPSTISKKLPPAVPPKPRLTHAQNLLLKEKRESHSLPHGVKLTAPLELSTRLTNAPYEISSETKGGLKSVLKTGSLQHNVNFSDIVANEHSRRGPAKRRKSEQDMSKGCNLKMLQEEPITLIL